MRRGLMGWNADELPLSTLHARLERLRTMMQQNGLDAFLLYTNMVRPAAVTHLTGFTPYWSDAIVLILRDGPPILATALSKRVAGWIRSTSPETEIVNAPKPGTAIGARLAAAATVKRVGVLELDALPSGYHDELVGAAPAIELVDASTPFASRRLALDTAERNLLKRADALAVAALDQVNVSTAEDAGFVAGLVEHHARMSGVEEIFVAVAPDLAADRRLIRVTRPMRLATRFAVRVSVAYKGVSDSPYTILHQEWLRSFLRNRSVVCAGRARHQARTGLGRAACRAAASASWHRAGALERRGLDRRLSVAGRRG